MVGAAQSEIPDIVPNTGRTIARESARISLTFSCWGGCPAVSFLYLGKLRLGPLQECESGSRRSAQGIDNAS
jgi:hypothetical protein